MKRLLLLLIISTVVLSAHGQAQQVIDANQDAAVINLQSMASSMGNNRCARVSEIRITDNGGYNTVTVFFHGITAADTFYEARTADTAIHKIAMAAMITKVINVEVPAPGMVDISAVIPAIGYKADTAIHKVAIAAMLTKVVNVEVPAPAMVEIFAVIPAIGYEAHTADTAIHKITVADIIINMRIADIPAPVIVAIDDVAIVNISGDPIQTVTTIDTFPIAIIVDNPAQVAVEMDIVATATNDDSVTVNEPAIPHVVKNDTAKRPVEEMHLSPDGYSLLQKLEGFAPALYSLNDGGYTIGFGFFVPYNEGYKWNNGVTWEEATQLIQEKVPAYEAQVKEYINVPLTQNEFDALTMLAYNLGGFSKATSIVNDINDQVDFNKLQSDWKRFVHSKAPNVAKGLMKRRKDELAVRKASDYQPNRKIQIYKSRK